MRPRRCTAAVVVLAAAALARAGPRPAPAAPAVRHGAPLLWRVERNGRVSHLFGTVHLPLDLDAALGDEGRTALDHAKRVFLELEFAPETIIDFTRQAFARGELPRDVSLHTLVRAETWTRLTTMTKDRIPERILDRMEPWFVAFVAVHLSVPKDRVPPGIQLGKLPLDGQIDQRARARRIPIEALESTFDHLQVVSRMPRDDGVAMIEEALANPEASREQLAGLVGAYVAADDRPLMKTFGRLIRRKPRLAERLLYRRNDAWCERLKLWLGDGRMFVAAGTFHMFGDRGLVALLRAQGYQVERVRAPVASAAATPRPRASDAGSRSASHPRVRASPSPN